MTDIITVSQHVGEVQVRDNSDFIYWTGVLKRLTAAMVQGKDLSAKIKDQIKLYRATEEEKRLAAEKKVLKQAAKMGLPAVVTKTVPEVDGIHYRHSTKWSCDEAILPREYMTANGPKIDATVEALGKHHGIAGVTVWTEEVVVVKG